MFTARERVEVLIHIEFRWNFSVRTLISIHHCRESVHKKISDSIMAHIKSAINFLDFVNCLFKNLPLETHVIMNNFIDESC